MQAWDYFLQAQEKNLGKVATDQWLRSLKVVHFDACNLYLEAKDSLQILWFEEHVRPLLKSSFLNNNFRPIKVHLTLQKESLPLEGKRKEKQPLPQPITPDSLNPEMTLENFVVGENNEVVFRFLKELNEKTTSLAIFNPIYLWGDSGCGKTHLLMGLTQAFQNRGLKALYARAMTFTEHVVSAIRSSEMRDFRKAYRHVDVLLIDDVHFLARKAATQEEFFHTFNALHTAGKQIILSANCSPQQLEDIEPRLVSRFEWGINLHFSALQKKQLTEILDRRIEALDFPLSLEVKAFLLERFTSSESLQAALEALILRCHMQNHTNLTPPLVERLLQDLLEQEGKVQLSPQKIIAIVSHYHGIRVEDLLGKSQSKEYALPRHLAMYLCRDLLHLPFMTIGQIFNRDHSTVMTGIRQLQSKVDSGEKECVNLLLDMKRKISTP